MADTVDSLQERDPDSFQRLAGDLRTFYDDGIAIPDMSTNVTFADGVVSVHTITADESWRRDEYRLDRITGLPVCETVTPRNHSDTPSVRYLTTGDWEFLRGLFDPKIRDHSLKATVGMLALKGKK